MNPRERILSAIDHREPDRVPIDLGATPSSGISAEAYNRLKEHLEITEGHTRIYDVVQQLAQPEDALLDRFGIDVVDLGRTFNTRDADWYDVTLWDGSAAQYPQWFRPKPLGTGWQACDAGGTQIAVQLEGMNFYDQTCFPWVDGYPDDIPAALPGAMKRVHWAALAHSPWDNAGQPDFWQQLRARALQLRQTSDRAIMLVCGCNLFEWGTFLRRIDNFLMDLASEPDSVDRLLDALMQVHLTTLEKVCAAVGDVADIIRFGDDLGMDTGPFMSRDTYRRFFRHRHAQLFDYVHRHSRMHTFLHSCGSIRQYLPDMIEAGLEVINPVQTTCAGMDPAELKRAFGGDITFWGGGCDTRTVLNHGTPEQVKDHVRQRVEIFAPGGGFVFNTVHNILPDVPPANIVAMYDALQNRGG